MRYAITPALALLLAVPALSFADPDDDARVALALALAKHKATVSAVGETSALTVADTAHNHQQAAPRGCCCSPACTCGCQEGGPCDCRQNVPAPLGAARPVAPLPAYAPSPAFYVPSAPSWSGPVMGPTRGSLRGGFLGGGFRGGRGAGC